MVFSRISERIIWPEEIDAGFMRNVINAFPFDMHALYELVGIFDILYNKNIRTAEMKLVGLPKIYINPEWAVKWIHTWADVAAVIYHELTHKMLDHLHEQMDTLLGVKLTKYQKGLLLDIRVQGLSYQIMNHSVYQQIWKRYYNNSKYPINLLNSAMRFKQYRIRALHKEIYSPFGVSLEKIAKFIFGEDAGLFQNDSHDKNNGDNSDENEDKTQSGGNDSREEESSAMGQDSKVPDNSETMSDDNWVPFVGNHDKSDVTLPSEPMLDYVETVRNVIEEKVEREIRRKSKEDAIRTLMIEGQLPEFKKTEDWGLGGSEFLMDLEEVEALYSADQRMQREMMKISVETEELKAKKSIKSMFPDVPDVSTYPNFKDKRAVVLYSLGHWPVYFENMIEDPRGLCHIYIDDSGSQMHVIAFVIKLFTSLCDYLHKEVHFFSTEIWTIRKSQLKPGMEIKTTGGTDMNVVVEHAIKNKINRCLVITDGYGPLSDKNASDAVKLKQKYLIGFTESRHGDGFDRVMWRQFDIPKEIRNETSI